MAVELVEEKRDKRGFMVVYILEKLERLEFSSESSSVLSMMETELFLVEVIILCEELRIAQSFRGLNDSLFLLREFLFLEGVLMAELGSMGYFSSSYLASIEFAALLARVSTVV